MNEIDGELRNRINKAYDGILDLPSMTDLSMNVRSGDGLADFIIGELSDMIAEGEDPRETLNRQIIAMETAREQLDNVIEAMHQYRIEIGR